MIVKRVMRRDARIATFRLENGRVIATYDDAEYGRQVERDGINSLRPDDGESFFAALDYPQGAELVVTVADEVPPASEGNIAGYRCPRCAYTGLHGRRNTYGERTIEEFFCPNCRLNEIADSNQPTYAAMLARWRSQ